MGSMSTTEPAPLPRLGEVFFDVRSKARSLRISWYSDTGVAVLSIWQGGTCTGSFRLPMGDVPRLIAALQAGPPAAEGPGAVSAQYGSAGGGAARGPAGPGKPPAGGSPLYPGGAAAPPYADQAPVPAAGPYGGGPYPASPVPASPVAGYPPAAAGGYPAASEAARYPGDASGYPAAGHPAAAVPPVSP